MLRLVLAAIVLVLVVRALGVDPFAAVPQVGGTSGVIPAPATEQVVGRAGAAFEARAVLLWLAMALSLPILTMSFLRSVVRQRNNALNACVVLIYVAIDLLAASAALPLESGWVATVMWGLAAALSLAVTLVTMSLALRLEA